MCYVHWIVGYGIFYFTPNFYIEMRFGYMKHEYGIYDYVLKTFHRDSFL